MDEALPLMRKDLLLESNAAMTADSHISSLDLADAFHFDLFKKRALVINGVVDSEGSVRFKKRLVSASREFPKGCARCAHRVEPTSNHVQQQGSPPVGLLCGASMKKSVNCCSFTRKLQSSNYSALRKFPLGCGQNARKLTVEEKNMILSSLRRHGRHDPKLLQSNSRIAEHQNTTLEIRKGRAINRASITKASHGIFETDAAGEIEFTDKRTNDGEKDAADHQTTTWRTKGAAIPQNASRKEKKAAKLEKRLHLEPEASTPQKHMSLKLPMEPVRKNSQGDDVRDRIDLDFFEGKVIVQALRAPEHCPWSKGHRPCVAKRSTISLPKMEDKKELR